MDFTWTCMVMLTMPGIWNFWSPRVGSLYAENMDLRDLDKLGIAFLVVNININYRLPATIGQTLEIETRMAHISAKSAKVRQEIHIKGNDQLVADADITFVIIDVKLKKVLPIKGEVRTIIDRFGN